MGSHLRVVAMVLLMAACGDPAQDDEGTSWYPLGCASDGGLPASDAALPVADATPPPAPSPNDASVATSDTGATPSDAGAGDAGSVLAPLAGTWKGNITGPNGTKAFTLHFNERGLVTMQSGKDSFTEVTRTGQVFRWVPEGGGVLTTTVEHFAMPDPRHMEITVQFGFEKTDSSGGFTQSYSRDTLSCSLTSAGLEIKFATSDLDAFGGSGSGSVSNGSEKAYRGTLQAE
jgi:hypothetical protein